MHTRGLCWTHLALQTVGWANDSVLLTDSPVASILVGGGSYVHSECEKQHHWGTGRRPPAYESLHWRDAISMSNKCSESCVPQQSTDEDRWPRCQFTHWPQMQGFHSPGLSAPHR